MRRQLIGVSLGAAAAALAWGLGLLPLAARLESATYDARLARTARPAPPDQPIAVVLINESSIRALAPIFGAWPWPRIVHAGAIDFLARSGARVIAYDVLFSEPDLRGDFAVGGRRMTGADSDAALVASVARAGRVVLAADATFETADARPPAPLPGTTYRPGAGFEVRPSLLRPFRELEAAAAAIGHTYVVKESDDAVRRVCPFIESQGVAVPSLGLAAALAAETLRPEDVALDRDALRIGSRRMPLLATPVAPVREGEPWRFSKQVLLNFAAQVNAPDGSAGIYPVYSFFDVLLSEEKASSGEKPAIDPAAFKGKIVFVGTSAAGLHDVYTLPFRGPGAPGVLLHATLADNVLSDRFMRRASARADAALAIGIGVAAGVLATALPVGWATAAVLALVGALVVWLTRQVGAGVWVSAVPPIGAATLALFGGVAWQYFVEGRAKRHIKQLFGRYVSRDVIDELMTNPALARLGGERREMTVLFSDIRGFTAASERGTPEAIVAQLNEYFGVMVEVLFRHRGTLDKFVGDMVMGLFGAPVADAHHADHAVAAARDMADALDRLNARWTAEGRPPLDIGIGINSGEMIAGNIGSETIMSYTVIGDAVNLGARLESLNKDYGTRILISQATRDRLTDPVETRLIGEVTVKGRAQAVVVYEVIVSGGQR
jgi:adenylate cyclase